MSSFCFWETWHENEDSINEEFEEKEEIHVTTSGPTTKLTIKLTIALAIRKTTSKEATKCKNKI